MSCCVVGLVLSCSLDFYDPLSVRFAATSSRSSSGAPGTISQFRFKSPVCCCLCSRSLSLSLLVNDNTTNKPTNERTNTTKRGHKIVRSTTISAHGGREGGVSSQRSRARDLHVREEVTSVYFRLSNHSLISFVNRHTIASLSSSS